MRQLFYYIILFPMFAALAHDVYIFAQAPDKGFRLSDTGALWDKYHKESHDQWKVKINEVSETLNKMNPMEKPETFEDEFMADDSLSSDAEMQDSMDETETHDETVPSYAQGFTQMKDRDGETHSEEYHAKPLIEEEMNRLQSFIGFVLEQNAVVVAAAFALIIYAFELLIRQFTGNNKRRSSELDKLEKMRRKKKKVKKKKPS